jgi:hypothetical protein
VGRLKVLIDNCFADLLKALCLKYVRLVDLGGVVVREHNKTCVNWLFPLKTVFVLICPS